MNSRDQVNVKTAARWFAVALMAGLLLMQPSHWVTWVQVVAGSWVGFECAAAVVRREP